MNPYDELTLRKTSNNQPGNERAEVESSTRTPLRVEHDVTTVRALIDRLAETRTGETFLISPETKHELTFEQLQQRAIDLARRLSALGLHKGDKVAFMLDNGLFATELFLGAMYGGFVTVPLNVGAGQSQLEYALNHSDAKVVFVSDEYNELLHRAMSRIGREVEVIPAHPDNGPDWSETEARDGVPSTIHEDDDALLVYTSGSTGYPKGVLVSHRSALAGGWNSVRAHQLSPRDRSLCLLPLYHMNAQIVTLLSTLLSGGAVVMPRRFNVTSFWGWVAEYRCTWFALVPTIISQLLHWTDPYAEGKGTSLEQVRFARSSSAPLAPSQHQAFEEKFRLLLIEAMGSTEAGGAVFTNPLPPEKRKVGSPGIPYGFDAKVVGAAGHELPPGQTGEVIIRGPSVMKGYYKNPEAVDQAIDADGWLRTGDLGYKDEDGYFFIVGRSKELIIKGGENIAPREIDEALGGHPAVMEAAAVGVCDPYLGEDIVAYVVLKPAESCNQQELLSFCERELGTFKTPARIHFAEDLPRGPSGKVQRLRLVEQAERTTQSETSVTRGDSGVEDLARIGPEHALATLGAPVEEALAAIWAEVLGLEQVGVHDNFFALGGHSLLAAQVVSRLRDTFQVGLSLRSLFEAPTVASLAVAVAQRVADLSPQQRALLELRLLKKGATLDNEHVVPRRATSDRAPLSFDQQRLWFLDQLERHSPLYNVPNAVRINGALAVEALQKALNSLVARHETLRTTFAVVEGDPVQVIAPTLTMALPVIDLSESPESEREASAQRLAGEEAQRPFDLARGLLFRASLLRLGETEHVLLLTMHHIISDGWSMGVLFRELGMLYEAFSTGKPSPLPDLPVQYADFAVWQRQWLQGEVLEKQLSYWRQQLGADLPVLALPTDRPRPAIQTYSGARQSLLLPRALSADLEELSRREGATLFMTLLGAFQTLLHRYTGQDDVVVGSPIWGRNQAEIEGLIGFFVNTLVMRTDLSGDSTFRELLGRVREVALGAYDHQDVPFEKLVEELQPERDLSRTPLFQVMFALPNEPALELTGMTTDRLETDNGTAKFDLTLFMVDEPEGLRATFEYNTDLFEAATITRMLGHFQTLLEGVVANPERHLSALPLLTEEERRQLLVGWNDTRTDYPRDACIHELFEAQAERAPDAVAVVFGDEQLTYRELNKRANQLAHHLRKLGVDPEVLVGICVERSMEMVVGLLGILKAGGAYVPLDPTYPKERLVFMLEDARVSVLLTQERLLEKLPDKPRAKVVRLDEDREEIAREGEDNPRGGATSENLAYVIYTSGSTGKPKGAAIEHRSAVNLLHWARDTFSPEQLAGILASTSISFDLSVFELFTPLSWGGAVILAESVLQLPALPAAREVTLINTVPSAMAELVSTGGLPDSARTANLAGEPLRTSLVRRVYGQGEVERVFDLYGPSEATTYSTFALRSATGPATVGRPIANTQIYLLDRYSNPVPIGMPGEIHIGGEGLARCYLNRPVLTEEKFVPHAFDGEPGARLYKTGDLARYLPDGNIEHLGRLDHQVKVRGFRVEPGEIEVALAEHVAVARAVAVAREDGAGGERLVAYVVATGKPAPDAGELRGYLKAKLPDYMVPAAFVVLEDLPLTPNGKTDRQALPVPEALESDSAYVAPRGLVEEALARVWAEVLGLERVGIHDDFFELGGHSLLAAQVFSRLRDALGVELPLRGLFETPTIAGLAERVDAAGRPDPAALSPIGPSLYDLDEGRL